MTGVDEAGSAGEGYTAPPGRWPEFGDPLFSQFLRQWAASRDGLVPTRSRIDPAAIRICLPHVWLIQYRRDHGDFVCTLAGEKVNEAWGKSIIGKPLTAYMPPEDAAACEVQYREVMTRPALLVSHRRIIPMGKSQKAAVRLVLPLSHDDGQPYGVFGMTRYYFDPSAQTDGEADPRGETVFYNCADLPPLPPP